MKPLVRASFRAAGGAGAGPRLPRPRAGGKNAHPVSPPPADLLVGYAELGTVTCSRGSGFIPHRKAETNIVHCQRELRNKAAELDAHVVVITSQQLGAGECSSCVTLVGTAYRRKSS